MTRPGTQLDRVALANAPAHVGLSAKLGAAAAFVAEHLSSFDRAYGRDGRVVTHLDEAVISGGSRREREALMGAPARYAEVVPADRIGEPSAQALRGAGGEAYAVRHAVDVVVYYGLPLRQRGPRARDTAAFRKMIEGSAAENPSSGLPGLRVALDAQAYLTSPGGAELTVSSVRLVALRPAWLADSGECRHEALLTLTIDG